MYSEIGNEGGPHVPSIRGFYVFFLLNNCFSHPGRIFIAEHGSWNRSSKIGYRVMQVTLEDGEALSYEPFAAGFIYRIFYR